MDKVKKNITSHQINNTLNTYNRLFTRSMHNLPINLSVLVYREGNTNQSKEWKGLYNFISIQSKSVIIEFPYGLTKF